MFPDLRFALRQLAKSPGFAVVAILSLALGIGANTAVFSLMNAVLLARLPVKAPEQLVVFNWLAEENVYPDSTSGWSDYEPGTKKTTSTSFSMVAFEAFQKTPGALSDVFAFAPMGGLNVIVDGDPQITNSAQVASGNYHLALGVRASAGRLFTPDDDQPSAEPVAVISYGYWQRRFGGDAAAIGKVITINGVRVSIVGVTAPSFNGAMQVGEIVDLTLPLKLVPLITPRVGDYRSPDYWWVRIMGRLKPGSTIAQARASLAGVFGETARSHVKASALPGAPAVDPAKVPPPVLRAETGSGGLYEARRSYEKSLQLLMIIVGLVLLVACANVANLLLARSEARRREIAVRLALGASRARLIRQLLAESVLLAALGALAGLTFAVWGTRALVAMHPFGSMSLQLATPLDWRVLGFTSAAALATGIIFGLAPALRATRLNLTEEFQGGVRALGGGARSTLAQSLMVVQVALSLVLLVGAGLFVRTLRNLQNVDVGFNREQLLLFQVNAAANGAPGPQAIANCDRLRDRIAALPSVRQTTYAAVAPLSQNNISTGIVVPGYVQTTVNESVRTNSVGDGYLATMEIPLLRGRDFNAHDLNADAPKVVIVNRVFAKKYFGTEDVVGRRFGRRNAAPDIEIIGLMRDALYSNVKSAAPPTVIYPYAQFNATRVGAVTFLVRFVGSEAAITAAARSVLHEIDSSLPMTNVRTQTEQIDRLFTQERLFANLCSFFGVLALGLAAIGLYGLMSYAVLRRTGEIGLRMALGALPAHVLRMILRESLALVALGVLIGIGAALGATRSLTSLLFGMEPNDPLTYVSVALLLSVIALIACLLPARRAAKIDPMIALRTE
jgi:predicted permease